MADTYTSRAGDTIDWVCWKHYGSSSGTVEKVLEANPFLSAADPSLPAGTKIVLPTINKPANTTTVVRLWG